MQNNQNNYWQKDEKNDEIIEVYQPEPDHEIEAIEGDQSNKKDDSINELSAHWSASEYISQEKNWVWYLFFGLIVLSFILIDWFVLKEFTFSVLVIVMAVTILLLSKRPAKMINYTLTGNQGLYIDDKLYHFSDFRAFGVLEDHGQHAIMLIPTKRFSPGVSVYFPKEVGEKIVDILGNRLPMEKLKLDFIDIIVQKIRL